MTARSEYRVIEIFRNAFAETGCLDNAQLEADAPAVRGGRINIDAAVAGAHFPWPCPNPHGAGWRSVMAAVSDLASVGAVPTDILLSVSVPDVERYEKFLRPFAAGAAGAAAHCGLKLVGGNVTRGDFQLHSVVAGRNAHPRAGFGDARPGDRIWITGPIGDAAAELRALLLGELSPDGARHYWYPEARLSIGQALWEMAWVVGAIDISDGWIADLLRLLRGQAPQASGAAPGAWLDPDAVPRSSLYQERWSVHQDPEVRRAAFVGGEDYELIFLSRDVHQGAVLDALGSIAPNVACVGFVQAKPGLGWERPPEVALGSGFGYDPYDGSP
ncbi:MAG: hypothetical protein D6761_03235 [Candidatus Dadabacteria bacterium]|nr:MAG: hypothetical protein D6761_03235 [Candidatus Dadabacteria bacterium]